MSCLDRPFDRSWQVCTGVGEDIQVAWSERCRQLQLDWAKIGRQRFEQGDELVHLVHGVPESFLVSDRSRDLETEPEVVRNHRRPSLDRLARRRRVVRGVSFDTGTPRRVGLEFATGWRGGWKPASNPRSVRPHGTPHVQLHTVIVSRATLSTAIAQTAIAGLGAGPFG